MTTTAENRRDALAEQLFDSAIGALETLHVYLGRKLGLYDILACSGPVSGDALAAVAGIHPRYAREWLEQQAGAGVLDVADETGDPATRTFEMAPGVADVVCTPDSPALVSPLASMIVGIGQAMPAVLEAFRTGGGVPYDHYGPDIREGIADINRPGFVHSLASDWVPALPDIAARLVQPDARVADLGCGTGASTLAIARGFPLARVDGLDLDAESIEAATAGAAEAGLSERVGFACRDAADPELAGRYDLVTMFEALHDIEQPVAALSAAKQLLAPGGAVLVGDEKVAERFTAPADRLDRFNYGWSAVHCLAAAMTDPDSAATGTVMREGTVRDYAGQAGFSGCTVLPIEHDFWRFYRLDP
jgi:SAM-dependent methyltransferase